MNQLFDCPDCGLPAEPVQRLLAFHQTVTIVSCLNGHRYGLTDVYEYGQNPIKILEEISTFTDHLCAHFALREPDFDITSFLVWLWGMLDG